MKDKIRADALQEKLDLVTHNWEQLREKVEQAVGHLQGSVEAARKKLIDASEKLGSLELVDSKHQEEFSTEMLYCIDELRRAYAMFDVVRSVKIWMSGYLRPFVEADNEVETKPEGPATPQHERLKAIADHSQHIHEFLEFAMFRQRAELVVRGTEHHNRIDYSPVETRERDALIYAYFDIDPSELENEKRAMLDHLRKKAEQPDPYTEIAPEPEPEPDNDEK